MAEEQEFWLSGPVIDIPDLLQPAAHALLQSNREVKKYLLNFPNEALWTKPFGRASVGFHLEHITGVLDRMLTYAKNEVLSEEQFSYLKKEGIPKSGVTSTDLLLNFEKKMNEALDIFKKTSTSEVTQHRTVGRKKLPTTVIGLYFHAAEHSQRHVGQLLVTASVVKKS